MSATVRFSSAFSTKIFGTTFNNPSAPGSEWEKVVSPLPCHGAAADADEGHV
jgi:hypothetical protein